LQKDEIAVCKKLLGRNVKNFYCLDCLAAYLNTTVEDVKEKIEEFKAEGCELFK
jgi:biotin operon repressor